MCTYTFWRKVLCEGGSGISPLILAYKPRQTCHSLCKNDKFIHISSACIHKHFGWQKFYGICLFELAFTYASSFLSKNLDMHTYTYFCKFLCWNLPMCTFFSFTVFLSLFQTVQLEKGKKKRSDYSWHDSIGFRGNGGFVCFTWAGISFIQSWMFNGMEHTFSSSLHCVIIQALFCTMCSSFSVLVESFKIENSNGFSVP